MDTQVPHCQIDGLSQLFYQLQEQRASQTSKTSPHRWRKHSSFEKEYLNALGSFEAEYTVPTLLRLVAGGSRFVSSHALRVLSGMVISEEDTAIAVECLMDSISSRWRWTTRRSHGGRRVPNECVVIRALVWMSLS